MWWDKLLGTVLLTGCQINLQGESDFSDEALTDALLRPGRVTHH